MKKRGYSLKPMALIVSLLIVFAVGFIGSWFTDTGEWYEEAKPAIAPPNYVFGIVWFILYAMIGLSIYFRWVYSGNNDKKRIVVFYGINLILNILWSYMFFGLKNPFLGMIFIILILASIIQLIYYNWRSYKWSAYLLIPYLLWVIFASILNFLTL